MPKERDSLWNHFERDRNGKGGKCLYCSKTPYLIRSNELRRLRKHLESDDCEAPDVVKEQVRQMSARSAAAKARHQHSMLPVTPITVPIGTVVSNSSAAVLPTTAVKTHSKRKKDPVWLHFHRLSTGKGAKCLHCKDYKTKSNELKRYRRHLSSADCAAPENVKRMFRVDEMAHVRQQQYLQHAASMIHGSGSLPTVGYTVPMGKEGLDRLFARVILQNGLPFDVAESESVRMFFKAFHPFYEPPSGKRILSSFVDSEYAEMRANFRASIAHVRNLCLLVDEWKNLRDNEGSLIHFVIVSEAFDKPYYVSSVKLSNTTEKEEQEEYLARVLLEVLENIGAEKFSSIVMDDCITSFSTVLRVVQDKYPSLSTRSCAVQVASSLMDEILHMKEIWHVVEKCIGVTQLILATPSVCAKYESALSAASQGHKLVLPNMEQWKSFFQCISGFLEEQKIIQTLSKDLRNEKDLHVLHKTARDTAFWDKLRAVVSALSPVETALGKLDGDEIDLSTLYEILLDLRACIEGDEGKLFDTERLPVIERLWYSEEIQHAYLLNPAHRGGYKLPNTAQCVTKFLEYAEKTAKFVDVPLSNAKEEFTKFLNYVSEVPPSDESVSKELSAHTWWSIVGIHKFPALGVLSKRLLSCVPTLHASQCIWRNLNATYQAHIDLLGIDKMHKLLAMHVNATNFTAKEHLRERAPDAQEVTDLYYLPSGSPLKEEKTHDAEVVHQDECNRPAHEEEWEVRKSQKTGQNSKTKLSSAKIKDGTKRKIEI